MTAIETVKPVSEEVLSVVGQEIPRKEDTRLLKGEGRFSDDMNLPNQTYAVMVRSIHPHALIRDIHSTAALSMPGVIGIFTGADCQADNLNPIPHSPVPSTKSDLKLKSPTGEEIFVGPHALLPTDKVRHVGEAVAMVVAESQHQAMNAAEAVEIDYEVLPWVTDSLLAKKQGSANIWEEVPDNICCDTTFGDESATNKAFDAADHVFSKTFRISRVTGVPLEPRAALGSFDQSTGRYTLYEGSNGAVRHKQQISAALGEESESLRVLCHDVGGNFGTKNRVYVEQPLILWVARKIGRPVKFTASRSESFLSDYQGRDLVTSIDLALRADGRFLALRASNVSNIGARVVSLSPLGKGIALVTGAYDIPVATARARAVFTNTVPTQAYRSSGRPEVTHALERLIDIAAHELDFDAIELRRMNLIRPKTMPYTNALGLTYDSGEYETNMNSAIELANWKEFSTRKTEANRRGKCLGRGLANYVESSIGNPRERTDIRLRENGTVEVVIGTQPTGQGQETSFSQVVADLLSIDIKAVDIVLGDTDIVKTGGGSHSGRSMRHASTVIYLASQKLIAMGKKSAAKNLGVDENSVSFFGGHFKSSASNKTVDWFELTKQSELSTSVDHVMHTPVFPNGCAACEVEVDPETGAIKITHYVSIDDVGRVINPMIVDGQTHGSIAQGVGQALWEQCFIDLDSGQPLCGSLMDYCLPRADQLPSFLTGLNEVLSPTNPLGVKSGGEGPTTPALAVVINAIVDALSEYGIEDIELPATSNKIWNAIQNSKKQHQIQSKG